METRVGVREEDTIKGNDEICVLSLSLSKKKGGMVRFTFLQKKKKK